MSKWNFKVVLAGDGAVGKTSIRERYMGKGFSSDYLKTIGADFASKKVTVEDNQISFQIWDLAGQDSYQAVRGTFYKGAIAALMVFDVQDSTTLTNVKNWVEEAIKGSNNSILTYFIIANKVDLVDKRRVSREMALDFCSRIDAETGIRFYYCETSALSGQNIQETFDFLAIKLLEANNMKILKKPPSVEGIIDTKELKQEILPSNDEYASKKEIENLENRINKLEKKLDTMQAILTKIIERI
ncbi:MAG: GTP-binding protein [Asgard group archaeon]|nr:GTP-binding protein [Asgard group archaeon]